MGEEAEDDVNRAISHPQDDFTCPECDGTGVCPDCHGECDGCDFCMDTGDCEGCEGCGAIEPSSSSEGKA